MAFAPAASAWEKAREGEMSALKEEVMGAVRQTTDGLRDAVVKLAKGKRHHSL